MKITLDMLHKISGNNRYVSRKKAFADRLNFSAYSKVTRPHEFALFIAQLMHESHRFRYAKEIWGPTAAQRRYETHPHLGNTQKGDGKRFMGRGLIQVTGRANYHALTKWCGEPDFVSQPELLEDDKWSSLGALWYWSTRVDDRFIEEGNHEMITRRINGGLNGYADRLAAYDKAAMVLLNVEDMKAFQAANGCVVDGQTGPETRAAFHAALKSEKKAPSIFDLIIGFLTRKGEL